MFQFFDVAGRVFRVGLHLQAERGMSDVSPRPLFEGQWSVRERGAHRRSRRRHANLRAVADHDAMRGRGGRARNVPAHDVRERLQTLSKPVASIAAIMHAPLEPTQPHGPHIDQRGASEWRF